MCVQSQASYSLIKHALISVYGKQWRKRLLGMFTTFVDDSGTAPEHKITVACGIVVPTARIVRFESEWKAFLREEKISESTLLSAWREILIHRLQHWTMRPCAVCSLGFGN